jgi:monothiol glutaredoxin
MTPEFVSKIDQLLSENEIVLFMKGTKDTPQCGFSNRVVGILKELEVDFQTVNVLADPEVRSSMKDYSQWPTFPQLYIKSEFVGGCDIITQMHQNGELAQELGVTLEEVSPPEITVTDEAKEALMGAVANAIANGSNTDIHVFFDITEQFQYDIYLDQARANNIVVSFDELHLSFSRNSAKRASGMTIGFVAEQGFSIDNPNEPASVNALSVEELQSLLSSEKTVYLFDVRTAEERQIAKIEEAIHLDQKGLETLSVLPKDAMIVFHCHHGMRSMAAAQRFLAEGYTNLFNLNGGIHAWSTNIDSTVPVY